MSNTDDRVRFTLRLPVELYEKVKAIAEENKRTVTKEIEYILEQHSRENKNET